MSALFYRVEPLTRDLAAELSSMALLYWQEVAQPFHEFPPRVDWETYFALAAQGKLMVLVGRDERGAAKGFAFAVLGPHPHYACMAARIPLLFLHPDSRRGREGVRLLDETERAAAKQGAQLMSTHGGMHNGVYRFFEARGYKDFGRYFVKKLEAS